MGEVAAWPSPDAAAARAVYERLWHAARASFAAGEVITDPHLPDRSGDRRRGLTLLIRPAPDVCESISTLLADLDGITPGQHRYHPAELHITLLSLVSAAPDVTLDALPVDRFRAVFARVMPSLAPFTVHFTHLGASRDSVFVYGHTEHDAINTLRGALRGPLHAAGLADRMEQRYRLVTTHATILRFQTAPAPDQVRALGDWLAAHRERAPHHLGTFDACAVEFIAGDWYMSRDVVRVLGCYPLGD